MINTALTWLDRGTVPIPLIPRTKKPRFRWLKWMEEMPPRDLVEKWFARKSNIALICGGENHLTVLDFDNLGGYYKWKSEMTGLWRTIANKAYRVRTKRGMHVYVYSTQSERTRRVALYDVDICADRHFVLSPPSTHPSGTPYTAIEGKFFRANVSDIFPPPVYQNPLHWVYGIRDDPPENGFNALKIRQMYRMTDYVRSIVRTSPNMHRSRFEMYRCPHPAHEDKNPSFYVDLKTNRAKCLSTRCALHFDKSMDIIDLHRALNGVSVSDAIKELARQL